MRKKSWMSFSIFLGLDNFLEEREIEDVQIIRDLCSSDRFFCDTLRFNITT